MSVLQQKQDFVLWLFRRFSPTRTAFSFCRNGLLQDGFLHFKVDWQAVVQPNVAFALNQR